MIITHGLNDDKLLRVLVGNLENTHFVGVVNDLRKTTASTRVKPDLNAGSVSVKIGEFKTEEVALAPIRYKLTAGEVSKRTPLL